MPCYHPLQAFFTLREDGKKAVRFSVDRAKAFDKGLLDLSLSDHLQIPCGRCMGCRLERSRQWAIRCMHEASLWKDNCFLTLTYNEKHVPVGGSLVRRDVQLFVKRLRKKFPNISMKFFYCGEYGDKLLRPHYHLCVFNFRFDDCVLWKNMNDMKLYRSNVLESLWTFGNSVIGDLTFDSAAYVARYTCKKICGDEAIAHYGDKIPEFAGMSLRPAIGREWIDKFGESDVFSYDELVVRGHVCKPPRYYDKFLEMKSPERFAVLKEKRKLRRFDKGFNDESARRLAVREKCTQARMRQLVRKLDCGVL